MDCPANSWNDWRRNVGQNHRKCVTVTLPLRSMTGAIPVKVSKSSTCSYRLRSGPSALMRREVWTGPAPGNDAKIGKSSCERVSASISISNRPTASVKQPTCSTRVCTIMTEACAVAPQAGFCEGEAHNDARSNRVTLPRPKGGSNREYKADLHTGGVLPTRQQ